RAPPHHPRGARPARRRDRARTAPASSRRARGRPRRLDGRLLLAPRAPTGGPGARHPPPPRRRLPPLNAPLRRSILPLGLPLAALLAGRAAPALPVLSEVLYDATGTDDGAV